MANVLRVTLGPHARAVVMAPIISSRAPELLTDSATIARRIIELPDPYVNMGAMLIRHMAWRMREKVGNGAPPRPSSRRRCCMRPTTRPHGGQRDDAQAGHRAGPGVAYEELKQMARPMDAPEQIEAMAIAAAGDEEIGRYVAEMLEIIGTDGVILVEDHAGRKTDREYVEGLQWDSGYVWAYFCTDLDRMEAVVENPVDRQHGRQRGDGGADPAHPGAGDGQEGGAGDRGLRPDRQRDQRAGPGGDGGQHREEDPPLPGHQGPRGRRPAVRILEDVAILTGGRIIAEDAGDKLEEATFADVGRARRVWANRDFFSIVGGAGRPLHHPPARQRDQEAHPGRGRRLRAGEDARADG